MHSHYHLHYTRQPNVHWHGPMSPVPLATAWSHQSRSRSQRRLERARSNNNGFWAELAPERGQPRWPGEASLWLRGRHNADIILQWRLGIINTTLLTYYAAIAAFLMSSLVTAEIALYPEVTGFSVCGISGAFREALAWARRGYRPQPSSPSPGPSLSLQWGQSSGELHSPVHSNITAA